MFNLGIFISIWTNKKRSREHSVFITEFGAGHFKEIMCKVLRTSTLVEKKWVKWC